MRWGSERLRLKGCNNPINSTANIEEQGRRSVINTEDFLALEFAERHGNDWLYCYVWNKWLIWDGKRWKPENTLNVKDLIRNICRKNALNCNKEKEATKLSTANTVDSVERLARADRRIAATAEEWDRDLWLLNTKVGIVDLRTSKIWPHDRSERMTKVTSGGPEGGCPNWIAFLNEVTGGDVELQNYLKRLSGYSLTGVTTEHILPFFHGTGANGKSVFVAVLADILGDYATTAPMDTFVETRSDRHPTDLAGFHGKRLVTCQETEEGRRWNESKIKSITGGDKITARFMRQDFFEYSPQFKLLIAGNHKPSIRNVDEAMKRRIHLVPFTITIPPEKREPYLKDKLLQERDGILAWAVAGCLEWQQLGLNPPACVLQATEEYFGAEDEIGQWMNECCTLDSSQCTLSSDLFKDWSIWAEHRKAFVGSIKRFSQHLIARQFDKNRINGLAAFRGIGLRSDRLDGMEDITD
jgi:putative DNA primase/helicase